ncbi:MAG: AraC family transcriptional regulator [Candidatus Izemoplasmatales bacterium]|jgi:AraC-like DNA-binding protein|nr:AraC family transcriptional regulator [Candidatus Izemoplasmatales bacterium]
MLTEDIVKKIDLLSKYSSVPTTIIYKQKVLFSSFNLISIEKLPVYSKIDENIKTSTTLHMVTYNSLECYGVFAFEDNNKLYTVVIGPVLTVRPISSSNLRYLSFYYLYTDELVRNAIQLIPLMNQNHFAHYLELFVFVLVNESLSFDSILTNKINITSFFEDDDFMNDNSLVTFVEDESLHLDDDSEKYCKAIKSGNLKAIDSLFKDKVLFHQFNSDNLKSNMYSLISCSAIFGKAAVEGGLDFFQASLLGSTIITLAEGFSKGTDFIASFKKLVHGYTIQVYEEQNKYHYSKAVRKAINYIEKHIHYPLSLAEISEYVKLSRPYLSQLFSKETGESLQSFVQARKLSEAENLLKFSKMSISEIASTLSFCSQSYFTEVFKKANDMTPVNFRKKYIHK